MKKGFLTFLVPTLLLADTGCNYPFGVNPPPISRETCNWGGHFDFLYLQISEDENPFAYVVKNDSNAKSSTTSGPFSFITKEYAYDYLAGFRIGIDAGLPCDEWNVSLDWTHYLHHNQGSVSATGNQVALSSYLNIGFFTPQDNDVLYSDSFVDSSLRTQLEVLDLVLNRKFYFGHQVTFCPYGGLRAFLLKQKVEASNTIHGAPVGQSFNTSTTNLKASTDFKGVGLVGGFFSTWDFLCQCSLYTDMKCSIFYGKSRSTLQGQLTNTGLELGQNLTFINAHFSHDLNTVKYAFDFALGLQWKSSNLANGSVVCLRAGWEEHLYFNQNTLMNLSEDQMFVGGSFKKPASNIAFQGLVLSATFNH